MKASHTVVRFKVVSLKFPMTPEVPYGAEVEWEAGSHSHFKLSEIRLDSSTVLNGKTRNKRPHNTANPVIT